MDQILNLVLPVFGVMAAGYAIGKFKILGQESSHALNAFVYYVAMPIMLFRAMASTDIVGLWDPWFIAIFIIPQFLVHLAYVLTAIYLFKRGFKEAMMVGMAASWGNAVYMGFPLAQTAFGEEVLGPVVIIAVFQALIFMVGTLLILDISDNKEGSSGIDAAKRSFFSFIKNPAMIAAMLGAFFSATQLPLPVAVSSFVDMLAPAAAPCALFAIGLFLTTQRLGKGLGEISIVTFVKLIISPILVVAAAYLAAKWGGTTPDLWVKAVILMAATPTGTLVFVIAQKHRAAEDRCSSAILVSSVVSVVTIPLLIGWL